MCRHCGIPIDFHEAIGQWWHVVTTMLGTPVAYKGCRDDAGNDIGRVKAEP